MAPGAGDGGGPVDLGISGYERAVEVGRGGFAVVYRAWQPGFDRHVAIKVVSTNLDPTAMSRFERECVAIGALSEHPNIVTVHELGWTEDGRPFIVMEFLTGGSLGDRLERSGPLDWQRAAEVTIKVAGALESAHRAGVLHRDIKPDNVLVSRYGDVKLGDFGIARIHGYGETATGNLTASWAHAPPELVQGQRPSVASDIYSLASMLYTLLAGETPFRRATDEGLLPMLARIPTEPVPDLRLRGVPDAVARAVEHGMAKDPSARPASAARFGRQLQDAQAAARVGVTALPLEIVDAAAAALPRLDRPESEEAPGGTEIPVSPVEGSAFHAGAPPVAAPAPPAPSAPPGAGVAPPGATSAAPSTRLGRSPTSGDVGPDGPPPGIDALPGNSGSGDGAVADQAPGRSKATVRRALLAVLVAVIVVVGVVVVLGGGDDDANDTAGGPTTAAPPAVVHFTVADELLPNDLTEVVDLSIDLGPPMRFNGSPGAAERADVTVPEAGPHAYRLVVTTTTKEGEVFTFTGAGDFEAQEGRHFEVLLVPDTPKTVCLALDGICQTATA